MRPALARGAILVRESKRKKQTGFTKVRMAILARIVSGRKRQGESRNSSWSWYSPLLER